ncbi:helix-turn-helix domain-containing protein [Bradyrhizobium sp. SZCCHNRI1073]|uniref:helix-turn-helix domain-containing protein n=1 Tax=Bradyrhizobium sp. SZCCHNRI1073 TaxID=3057280 RepID=UPI003966D051
MPPGRDFHPLTVDVACPSASATVEVPPRSSMISSAVSAMSRNIVRTARTCQGFAESEATFRIAHAELSFMDSDHDVGRRLIAVREHFQLTQTEFAKRLHLAKNTLNGYERGNRTLTMETARRIRARFGVSTDWLLFGDVGQPSHDLAVKLGPSPAVGDATVSKEKPPRRRVS